MHNFVSFFYNFFARSGFTDFDYIYTIENRFHNDLSVFDHVSHNDVSAFYHVCLSWSKTTRELKRLVNENAFVGSASAGDLHSLERALGELSRLNVNRFNFDRLT